MHVRKMLLYVGIVGAVIGTGSIPAFAGGGFDQYGYNDKARVFVGAADGVDRNLDGTVWGDSTYANDHLQMNWNAAWDACNDHGYDDPEYCKGAWTTNNWNGMRPDGSQTNYHVKIIWVGSAQEASPYWVTGGYSIWNNYEVIMEHEATPDGHVWYAKGIRPGLGG